MAKSIYDFSEKTIDGRDKSLGDYRGKVALIVNVASRCGYTPQYKGLEELHETYGAKGLAVLGFPANEFGSQEPGTDDQIKDFCTTNYGVKFDMFAKVKVKGAGIDPLFEFLKQIDSMFRDMMESLDGEIARRLEEVQTSGTDPRQRGATWTYLTTDNPFGSLSDRIRKRLLGKVRSWIG